MRKILTIALAAALLSSCSVREKLYVQLPGTTWSLTTSGATTWVCFHDQDSASLLQFRPELGRIQIDHGTYVADGHVVTISTEYASDFTLQRTFLNLKRASSNDNYSELLPYSFSSLTGSIWVSPVSNDLHIAYFPSDTECLDLVYSNITRVETNPVYGWSVAKKGYTLDESSVKVNGSVSATLFNGIASSGTHAAMCVDLCTEEGTSSLKGTVWTYSNTGYPADVPSVVIFNGKDSFLRLSGMWTGNVSSSSINPIVFEIASGKYTESGGNLTLTIGDKEESCPISGDSFTLFEKSYKKLAY